MRVPTSAAQPEPVSSRHRPAMALVSGAPARGTAHRAARWHTAQSTSALRSSFQGSDRRPGVERLSSPPAGAVARTARYADRRRASSNGGFLDLVVAAGRSAMTASKVDRPLDQKTVAGSNGSPRDRRPSGRHAEKLPQEESDALRSSDAQPAVGTWRASAAEARSSTRTANPLVRGCAMPRGAACPGRAVGAACDRPQGGGRQSAGAEVVISIRFGAPKTYRVLPRSPALAACAAGRVFLWEQGPRAPPSR